MSSAPRGLTAIRLGACLTIYSVGVVLLTVCVVDYAKHPPSLVVANFGPRGNEWTARTPHRMLVDYIEKVRNGDKFKLDEATRLVHFATRHIGNRDIAFTENWVQWMLGRFYRPLRQTQDTDLLIEGRLGNCADRCQILKTVAELSGKRCRFVGLTGHVVLEVEVDEQWCVADPDYDVTFPMRVDALANPDNESMLRQTLQRLYSKPVVDEYVRIIQSESDNRPMPVGSPLSPRLFVVERVCQALSWILPFVFMLAIVPLWRVQLPRSGRGNESPHPVVDEATSPLIQ